jgi:hypothetical protein
MHLSPGAPVAKRAMARVFVQSVLCAAVVNLVLRELYVQLAAGASDVPALRWGRLAVATFLPVVMSGPGYLASFGRPRRASLAMFVGPGLVGSALGCALALSDAPSTTPPITLGGVVLITILPTAIVTVLLLRLRTDPSARYEPPPSPGRSG